VSLMWMTVELLVPLRLDGLGFSASRIGLVFSAASVVFAGASVIAARGADRYATIRYSAVWTTLLAVGLAFGSLVTSAPGTFTFLLMMSVTSGMIIAITYPLGAIGAREGGFSVAVVGALLNMVWALSGIVGPLVGGSISGAVGDAAVYAVLGTVSVAGAVWMWTRPRAPAVQREPDAG
jgi:MFS family permease